MSNSFEIVGRLAIGKETEKFKPFRKELGKNNKKWENVTLNMTAIAGDNRHFLEVRDGHWVDDSGKLYLFSKGVNGAKGSSFVIDFADRFNEENIEKTAMFKKFIVDLEEPNRRKDLEKAVEEFKKGTLTNERMQELNITNPEADLQKSKAKRKEFLSGIDFAEFLHKLIQSGKFSDRLFTITGDKVFSEYNGKFREVLAPKRVYLAKKDAMPKSEGTLDLFFNQDSVDESRLLSEGLVDINAFVKVYDNNRKSDIACPVKVTLDRSRDEEDEKLKKVNDILLNQFTVLDNSWKQLGVKVKMLNGSQRVEITEDMLNEFQKEMIEIGAMTLEDVARELGGDVYGDPIQETIVFNVSRGFAKGRVDTAFSDEDFRLPDSVNINNTNEESTVLEDDEDDIFAGLDIE